MNSSSKLTLKSQNGMLQSNFFSISMSSLTEYHNFLTLSLPGSEMYVSWPGGGKFTSPYYLPKYCPNHYQTLQGSSVYEEDQKNPNEFLDTVMTSSYKSNDFISSQVTSQCNAIGGNREITSTSCDKTTIYWRKIIRLT